MKVVVLGMHRSGTSLMTGILNNLGFYIGEANELSGAGPENPKGFFERKDFRKINDTFLFSNDSDWYKVSDFIVGDASSESLFVYENSFREVIEKKLSTHKDFAIKEPRFNLTFPFFKNWLGDHKVIFVYRDPLDVAYSLYKRNGFPIEFGLALWEFYNKVSLKEVDLLNTCFVNYSQLVSGDEKVKQELSVFLERDPNTFDFSFADKTLQRSNNHHHSLSHYLKTEQKNLYQSLTEGDFRTLDCSISGDLKFTLEQHQKNYESIIQLTQEREDALISRNQKKSENVTLKKTNTILKRDIVNISEKFNLLINSSKVELISKIFNLFSGKKGYVKSIVMDLKSSLDKY
jgi:hypothetical protein